MSEEEYRAELRQAVEQELAETPDGVDGFDVPAIVDEIWPIAGADINAIPPYMFWKTAFAHEVPAAEIPGPDAMVAQG